MNVLPFGPIPGRAHSGQPISSDPKQHAEPALREPFHGRSAEQAETRTGFDGFKIFDALLSRAYEALNAKRFGETAFAANRGEPASAESAAATVLGFVEQGLRNYQAAGASAEQLAKRLDEGLAGFNKGFNEARDQIKALGLLNPELDEDITKTYDLVTGGIDDLRGRFIDAASALPSNAPPHNTSSSKAETGFLAAASASYSYRESNSISFELETRDGDTVTIRAASSYGLQQHYESVVAPGANFAYAEQQAFYGSSFYLEVDGELDEGEVIALNELMAQVELLSKDFFDGNIDAAFDRATSLGYDSEEILGFSLNLRHVEVERVCVAYQQHAPVREINPLARQLAPVTDFATRLLEALELAERFAEPVNLLSELAERFGEQAEDVARGREFSRWTRELLPLLDARR